jgi:hypothetical protein
MVLTLVSPSLSRMKLANFSMKTPTVRAAYISYKFTTVRVGFQVLTEVVMKSTVFWDTALRALIATYISMVSCSHYSSTLKIEAICSFDKRRLTFHELLNIISQFLKRSTNRNRQAQRYVLHLSIGKRASCSPHISSCRHLGSLPLLCAPSDVRNNRSSLTRPFQRNGQLTMFCTAVSTTEHTSHSCVTPPSPCDKAARITHGGQKYFQIGTERGEVVATVQTLSARCSVRVSAFTPTDSSWFSSIPEYCRDSIRIRTQLLLPLNLLSSSVSCYPTIRRYED